MRNRAIQSNQPFVAPTDDDDDWEPAFEKSPVNAHNNLIQTNSNEEISEEVMLNEEGTTIP